MAARKPAFTNAEVAAMSPLERRAHRAAGVLPPAPCRAHDWKLREGGVAFCGRCGYEPPGQDGY